MTLFESARLFPVADQLDSDSWYTPPWVFDGLGLTFDLDVAAPAGGLSWVAARRSYSVGPFAAWSAASSVYVPSRRLHFVDGRGGPTGLTTFSTLLLGRGAVADAALQRLANRCGGIAKMVK